MAQPEESFKVCGLCSQLVDEAVKLTDILLDFLTKFLNVDGSKLPSKICTECFQGAIDSKKFKEKCLRTVEKLKKTHISSTMILGRSTLDVKQMKHKFKNGLDLVDPEPDDTKVATKQSQVKHGKDNIAAASHPGRRPAARLGSRNSSINSINEDTPLSSRTRKTNIQRSSSLTSLTQQYGSHMQPRVRVPEAERRLADDMLLEGSNIERSRSGRVLKRKVASPEDPVPLDFLKSKKVKTEPGPDTFPYRPGHKQGKPKSKAPRGYKGYAYVEEPEKDSDLYDADENEEEIFPSLGPYQCEICQEITDTKQEFVAHIKALHKDMVDEAVLRSLESDLKKRKKKEMAASPEGKKPLKPVKSPVLPVGAPPKIDKLKPRPRPIKRYTEVESDDEYKPSRSKKILKKKSSLKTEVDPAVIKAKLEPGTCNICGANLSRATDIPKHQESLKCRQAAFNLAQERHKKAKEEQKLEESVSDSKVGDEDEVGQVDSEEGDKKLSVIQEKVSEIDKNDVDAIANKVLEETFGSSPNKVLDTFDGGSNKMIEDTSGHNTNKVVNSFGNNSVNGTRVPSDSDDVAHNVPNDAKFKNSIAKRYEAERNDSSDSKETENPERGSKKEIKTTNSDEYELDFDEEAAIKAAMQESIETAQKELGHASSKVTTPINKTNSPSVVGDHSPAAYIDPAPQPDVEPFRDPSKSSVIVPNMSKHQQHGITGKEWVDTCREPTTVDLEALGEPTSLPPQPNLPVHMDSLESQMAALHGAAGANTPWQEFNEKYFGH